MIERYQQHLTQLRSTDAACRTQWYAGLTDTALQQRGFSRQAVTACEQLAMQRCFWQLLRALVREGFWQAPDSLTWQGNDLPIALTQDTILWLQHTDRPSWGLFTCAEQVTLCSGETRLTLDHPAQLLALLLTTEHTTTVAAQRFYAELQNSMLNDSLFLAWRQHWQQQLITQQHSQQQQTIHNQSTGYDFWQQCKDHVGNSSLLLEQWATVGHPVHPAVKCKQGMTATEVLEMAPEFQGQIEARLIAVRTEILHAELSNSEGATSSTSTANYRMWFRDHFAGWYQRWAQQLTDAGLAEQDFLPMPVHPWQAERTLAELFAEHIDAGDIQLLHDGPELRGGSTMSFRTIVPQDRCDAPHIKLPIAMRLTSGQRIVSTRSCQMGPRFSAFLQQCRQQHPIIGQYLTVMNEAAGVHYQAAPEKEDRLGKHLSVLYRDNPMASLAEGEYAIPVAALLVDCPEQPLSLFSVLSHNRQQAQPTINLTAQFADYLAMVLRPVLALYLRYGIAIEAHQQNSFAIFSDQGEPLRLLARDFGAFRVYAPIFQRSGGQLQFHRDRSLISDDPAPARNKLLHAVFICHIAELINTLCHEHQLADQPFWQQVRDEVKHNFAHWQADSDTHWWQQEYQALLQEDWCMKLFSRMRLADTGDDMYHHFRNPLRDGC